MTPTTLPLAVHSQRVTGRRPCCRIDWAGRGAGRPHAGGGSTDSSHVTAVPAIQALLLIALAMQCIVAGRNAEVGHGACAVPGRRGRPEYGVLSAVADDLARVVDILRTGVKRFGKETEIDHRVAAEHASGFEVLQIERLSRFAAGCRRERFRFPNMTFTPCFGLGPRVYNKNAVWLAGADRAPRGFRLPAGERRLAVLTSPAGFHPAPDQPVGYLSLSSSVVSFFISRPFQQLLRFVPEDSTFEPLRLPGGGTPVHQVGGLGQPLASLLRLSASVVHQRQAEPIEATLRPRPGLPSTIRESAEPPPQAVLRGGAHAPRAWKCRSLGLLARARWASATGSIGSGTAWGASAQARATSHQAAGSSDGLNRSSISAQVCRYSAVRPAANRIWA